jgi:hypothetical protein
MPTKRNEVKSRLISWALFSLKTLMIWGIMATVTKAPPIKAKYSTKSKPGLLLNHGNYKNNLTIIIYFSLSLSN